MNKTSYRMSRLRFVVREYPGARTFSKYVVALLGQAGLGAFNFCLNIVLLRSLSAHDYGSYALCFVFATLATSVNGALCSGPLIVFGTARSGSPSRLAVETLLSTINAGIVFLVLLVSVPVVRSFTGQNLLVCFAAAGFISSFAYRTYTRTFAYARLRPRVALAGDILNIALGSSVLLANYLTDRRIDLSPALFALAAGNVGAAMLEMRMLGLGCRMVVRRCSLRRYGVVWKQARWSLVGSTTTLVQNQAHSFLVTLAYGPTAFAPLAAGQVVVGPLRILATAWHYVMQPEIVLAIRRYDGTTIRRTLKYSALALTCIVLALGAAVASLWYPVFDLLYAGKYEEDAMRLIVSMWCVIALCGAISCAPSGVLQACRRYRVLALATVYGAALSIFGVAVVLSTTGPEWSLLGVLLGEAFVAQYTLAHALSTSRGYHSLFTEIVAQQSRGIKRRS